MDESLFSVVIPTFNREETIVACLESVSQQSLPPLEVLVIDDGSTDQTVSVASRFNVEVICQENAGPGSARNQGIQRARGQYVAFLDSDDFWFPWSLEVYAEVIHKERSPAFVAGSPYLFRDESELQWVRRSEVFTLAFRDYLSTGEQWLWHGVSSFVIRRDVLQAVGGFAPGKINGEDADLAIRIGTQRGFVHISSPQTFAYRIHDGNVTSDHERSKSGIELLLENERQGRFPGGRQRTRDRAVVISRHVRPFAVDCARKGRILDAFRLYVAILEDSVLRFRWKFLIGLPLFAFGRVIQRLFGHASGD